MKSFKDNIRIHIILIILLSVVLRIAAGYIVGHKFHPQEWEYEILAKNMIEKNEFSMNFREYGVYKAIIAPGYSFIIYTVYKAFGVNPLFMLFFQFVTMTFLAIIIYQISWIIFKNHMIAFIAGVMAVLHPGILYYSVANIHNFNLYLPLFYACVLLFCMALRDHQWKYYILIGITGGIGILTRGTILPFLIMGLILCLAYPFPDRKSFKGRLLKVSIAFIIAIAINVPWTIRNYMVLGKVIYSQSTKWEQFWVGNNLEATGSHYRPDGTTVLSHKPPEMQKEIDESDSEIKDDEIFRKYSLRYVQDNPGDFIKGIFKKGVYFWWFNPQTGLFYPKSFLIAYMILYLILLVFTGAGLWICWKLKLFCMEMVFLFLLVFDIWGVHTLNFMEMRHRWTVEPVLLIFASVAIYSLAGKIYLNFCNRNKSSNHTDPSHPLKDIL